MNWFRNLMMGRYGGDQLSMALIVLSLVLTLIASITGLSLLTFLGYIPLLLAVLRMFSKNIQKRQMENYRFAMLMSPVYAWFKKTTARLRESKTNRFYVCPNCKAQLRVPKGKGKICITCPKCGKEFVKKT